MMASLSEADILTPKELVTYLRVSDETIYRMVREKQVPNVKVRGQIRFLGWKIINWLNEDQKQA